MSITTCVFVEEKKQYFLVEKKVSYLELWEDLYVSVFSNMQSDQKEVEENVNDATFGILPEESDVKSEINTDVNLSSLSNITETSVTIDSSSVGNDTNTGDGISTATSLGPTSLIPENLVLVETSKG